jgi:hypothetical protein
MIMTDRSYRTVLAVEATPDAAYAAINDVRGWWSEDLDGSTDRVGAEFDFRGNHEGVHVHRALIRVTDLVPGERVAWHVVENHFSFTDDQSEWTGTRIVFEIAPSAAGAEIRFSHLGLEPDDECFEVCSNAWAQFLHDSLRAFIETGEGRPMQRLTTDQPARSA